MGKSIEVRVPDIGDYRDVPVIDLLVRDGDTVAVDAPMLVLESDKATLEVPAPGGGVVRGIKLKVGDKVSMGDLICVLEPSAGAAEAQVVPEPPTARADKTLERSEAPMAPALRPNAASAPSSSVSAPVPAEVPYAGPATRKFARELGVDLSRVPASGLRGRVVVEDVQRFVKGMLAGAPVHDSTGTGIPPIPVVDFSQFGPVELKPLARIRRLSATHLHRSWLNAPHVTQFEEVDITDLEAFRKANADQGMIKLTLLPFVMKAVAATLRAFPEFNSALAADGESLVIKRYCHVGFAADTENGLVVPVVRNVWDKGVLQLAGECADLAKKARDGKLKGEEMKGGCFSISSLGGIGGSFFTPIVNAPEVAILGVSRAQTKPWWDGQQFAPRLMCPLSLSYDHRVIDGAAAARFIVHLSRLLTDVRRLLM